MQLNDWNSPRIGKSREIRFLHILHRSGMGSMHSQPVVAAAVAAERSRSCPQLLHLGKHMYNR
jgi:hypothetical protein